MKKLILLLICWSTFTLSKAQGWTCNQSTASIVTVFYPNTTTNYTVSNSMNDLIYLCSANATVYDTSEIINCNSVIIDAFSTYIYSAAEGCTGVKWIYMKANSNLTIKNLGSGGGVYIYREPGANITNLSSTSVSITACSTITIPSINCMVGIDEKMQSKSDISVYPNPAEGFIYISSNGLNSFDTLEIVNVFGVSVLRTSFKHEIDISQLAPGIYNLKVQDSKDRTTIRKLIIAR
jgi:hypothetical protein